MYCDILLVLVDDCAFFSKTASIGYIAIGVCIAPAHNTSLGFVFNLPNVYHLGLYFKF